MGGGVGGSGAEATTLGGSGCHDCTPKGFAFDSPNVARPGNALTTPARLSSFLAARSGAVESTPLAVRALGDGDSAGRSSAGANTANPTTTARISNHNAF